jgi:PilZ domain
MPDETKQIERRTKKRFPIHRELRYKLLENDVVTETGIGETLDLASGGVAFQIDHPLKVGTYVELSISWPVLLDDSCAMRLIVSGRVVRIWGKRSACRVEKYDFRTQARNLQPLVAVRNQPVLQNQPVIQRFPPPRKEAMKASGF